MKVPNDGTKPQLRDRSLHPSIMRSKKIDFAVVRELALALPGVEEGSVHGAPSLKVRGRLLACPAIHSSVEPNSIVVRIDFEQRAELLQGAPNVYYVTEHYVKHPAVLVRLGELGKNSLRALLQMAWRFVSSK